MDDLDSSTSSHESHSVNAVVEGLLRVSVANFMRGKPLQADIITSQTGNTAAEKAKGKSQSHTSSTSAAQQTRRPWAVMSQSQTESSSSQEDSKLGSSFIVSPVQQSRSSTTKASDGGNKENDAAQMSEPPTISICDAPVRDMEEDSEMTKGQDEILQKPLEELWQEKATLKKRLRQYDISFEAKYGRKPEKVDKEPIRHLYQKYHDYKKAITAKQAQEPGKSPVARVAHEDKNKDEKSMLSHNSSMEQGQTDSSVGSVQNDRKTEARHDKSQMRNTPSPGTVNDLKREKRELQVKLRDYEEKFMAQHGRKVRYHRDIVPVAAEYKRYKEIKNALRIEK